MYQFSENFDISCLSLIGDSHIAVGGIEGEMRLYDARNTKEVISEVRFEQKINEMYALDLRNIVVLTEDVHILDNKLEILETLVMENKSDGSLRKTVYDKKRAILVVGGFDGVIHLIKICKFN